MSVLYPEENLLPSEAHSFEDVLKHGADLAKGGLSDFVDWAKKDMGWGKSPQDLAADELKYNGQAVAKLKAQYAKHDERYKDISDKDFLTLVIKTDKENIHSVNDLDNAVQGRMKTSVDHENGIMAERTAARDGVNFDNKSRYFDPELGDPKDWVRLPGEYNYGQKFLEQLSDDQHKDLIDKFKGEYKKEIDEATQRAGGDEKAGYWAVLNAVKQVHDDEIKNNHVTRGEDFHNKVQTAADAIVDGQMKVKTNAEHQASVKLGINLDDPAQRAELAHASAAMGHDDGIPADKLVASNPLSKMVVDKFTRDFAPEIQANNGDATKVLAAVGAVWNDPQGENKGAIKLTPEQYRSKIDAEMTIQASGIDLSNDGQRAALIHATNEMHSNLGVLSDDKFKAVSLENKAAVVASFQNDFAAEIKAAGGDSTKVLDAINKVYKEQEEGKYVDGKSPLNAEDFHKAVAAEVDKQAHPDKAAGGQDKDKDPAKKDGTVSTDPNDIDVRKRVQAELAELGQNDNVQYHKNHQPPLTAFDGVIGQHSNKDLAVALGKDRAANAPLTEEDVKAVDAKYAAKSNNQQVDVAAGEAKFLQGGKEPGSKEKPTTVAFDEKQLRGLTEGQRYIVTSMIQDEAVKESAYKDGKPVDVKKALQAAAAIVTENKMLHEHPEISMADAKKQLDKFRQDEVAMSTKDLQAIVNNAPQKETTLAKGGR